MQIVGYYTNNACMAGPPPPLQCDPTVAEYLVEDEKGNIHIISPDIISPPLDPLEIELYMPTPASEELATLSARDECFKGENPEIQNLLSLIKETEPESAIYELEKIQGGPACLRLIIQEGTFMQYYLSARSLTESPLPEADTVIRQMITNSTATWEKALGLILLGSRTAAGIESESNPAEIISPFLVSEDPLLRLGAIFGLLRMDAENELNEFAEERKGSRIAQTVNGLLSYKGQSTSYVSTILFDWADPGTYQTAFFRHPTLLDELVKDAQVHPAQEYNVWEIGCSLGLSTESARIALSLNREAAFHITGTDISPFALLYAARGKYLLENLSHIDHYYSIDPQENDLQSFRRYVSQHNWNPEKVLNDFFTKKECSLGPLYTARRDPGIHFIFDDVASTDSSLPDTSFDTIIYANVHYFLSREERARAIQKIHQKLKPGGEVFVVDPRSQTYIEFEAAFGNPTIIKDGPLMVYRKD
ncbi:MAG: methyltransferase domain-containing protein [Candidatus Saganbacteria bacterium]|nr:methyltransferase domain-containing protein [Candidatus Saganbacteria bacterium]